MALNIDECVEFTHLKNKITAVIPTSNASIECLLWCVFSLLLRSKPDGLLEHFCVCINGPDVRTGNPEPQDIRQAFLEELRDIDWYHADSPNIKRHMPITVIRAWSRVGYAESMEMALPWVHTDSYLIMHDDVFLTTPTWEKEVEEKFYKDEDVAIAHIHEIISCGVDSPIHRGMYLLRLPQLDSTFVVCRKKWIMKAQASWVPYHIPSDDNFFQFAFEDLENMNEFFDYYKRKGLLSDKLIMNDMYNFLRQEQGAWIYYKLCQLDKKFVRLDDNIAVHLERMSRSDDTSDQKKLRVQAHKDQIKKLESEIMAHPRYNKIYQKYMGKSDHLWS